VTSRRGGVRVGTIVKYIVLTVFALAAIVVPLWAVIVNSMKTEADANTLSLSWPKHWAIRSNYSTVINQGHLLRGFRNTAIIAIPSVFLAVVLGAMAAWIFARRKGRSLNALYFLAIAGIFFPPAVVTTVRTLQWFHVYGSYLGVIVFYVSFFMCFAVFLMTGFVKTIPMELEEAALIDGASPWTVFRRIVFPLLRPVVATTAFITLLFAWNDFLWPFFLLNQSSKNTLTLGLYNFISASFDQISWNFVFADVVVVSLPLIVCYYLVQRWLVGGFLGTGGKG
jgi:raffinose/stachyose/melibiose transport system permease protein